MDDLQKVQYSILKEFDRVCTAHGIPYSLGYGTAIGAVRHKGFIPWDNDIDVLMLRSDLARLEALWEAEADPNLFFQTCRSDPGYPLVLARIRDGRTTMVEHLTADMNIHHGVYIDVYPYDYAPKNRIYRLWQFVCSELIWMLARKGTFRAFRRVRESNAKNGFERQMRVFLGSLICLLFPGRLRMLMMDFLEKQIVKCRPEQAIGVFESFWGLACRQRLFPRDMLRNLERTVFEDGYFLLTKDYDAYLRTIYGDYMTPPPEGMRVPVHDYLFADTQRPYTEAWRGSQTQ